ncbi:WAG22 antigen-like [Portunus trituberculatus]|uniref:WAG22 antigen-like n=1 Tax=Portunus trituberculatus TaxID=210409 RepID=UPI001E1D1202|nr:WAG22 antigen-like [Portunus trituberculatus]
MRVWLAVLAILGAAAVAVAEEPGGGPIRISTTGNTGRRGTAGRGRIETPGRSGENGNPGGGEVVKAELRASHLDVGAGDTSPIVGHKRTIDTVGHSASASNVSPRLPLGTTGKPNEGHKDEIDVVPARMERIINTVGSAPVANGESGSLRTATRLAGAQGNVTHRTATATESSLGNTARGNRNQKRGASEDRLEAAKIAATIHRAIPVDLSKYGGLDNGALLSLANLEKINRAAALSFLGKGDKGPSGEISKAAIKSHERSQESPKNIADIINKDHEITTGANKREIFSIVDIDDCDSGEVFGVRGKGSDVFGIFSKGDSRERQSDGLFSGKGNSRERCISRRQKGGKGKGSSNIFGLFNKGSKERPGGLFGKGGGSGLDIFGIFNKGDSKERFGGLFGKGGGGGFDLFGLFDKGNSKENFGKGGLGHLDIFGLFDKGNSKERSGLFGKGGRGRGLDIFGIFDKGDSREKSRGLFRKGEKGDRGGLEIIDIFDKDNSREKSIGLIGKGVKGERGSLEVIGILDDGGSREKLIIGQGFGGLNRGGVFGKGAGGLDISGSYGKGSREGLSLFTNKGQTSKGRSGGLFNKGNSKERSGGLFANKGRRGGGLLGNAFDLFRLFNKGSKERSGGLFNKGNSKERSRGLFNKGKEVDYYHDSLEIPDLVLVPSKEKSGLFGNKGTGGGLFGVGGGKNFDILDLFKKGSKERSPGLFGGKGLSKERFDSKFDFKDDSKETLFGSNEVLIVFDFLKDLHHLIWGR